MSVQVVCHDAWVRQVASCRKPRSFTANPGATSTLMSRIPHSPHLPHLSILLMRLGAGASPLRMDMARCNIHALLRPGL